jgi:transcriptional regulator with XRE-family HTH domain
MATPTGTVGLAIKDVRSKLLERDGAYTQEHVAHEAGVSLRHYQKIEAGQIDVRLSTLFAIAAVLGRRPQQILDRAEELRPARRR